MVWKVWGYVVGCYPAERMCFEVEADSFDLAIAKARAMCGTGDKPISGLVYINAAQPAREVKSK